MDEKRRLQAVKDAAEAKQNEDIRRKSGKDEAKIKAELQLKEANLEALKRKKGAFLVFLLFLSLRRRGAVLGTTARRCASQLRLARRL